jgi:hypothetical protein
MDRRNEKVPRNQKVPDDEHDNGQKEKFYEVETVME